MGSSDGRLLSELQRLVGPHLGGESSCVEDTWRTLEAGGWLLLRLLPSPPSQEVTTGFSA